MFPRDEICPYSEKKFASGVNFSRNNIFSPIISSAISSSLIMLYHEWTVSQIMHFKDVKNFACKSGSVKFWTNIMSDVSQLLEQTGIVTKWTSEPLFVTFAKNETGILKIAFLIFDTYSVTLCLKQLCFFNLPPNKSKVKMYKRRVEIDSHFD